VPLLRRRTGVKIAGGAAGQPDTGSRLPEGPFFVASSTRVSDIIGHNDAAAYNAVWRPIAPDPDNRARGDDGPGERLVGFVDWDFAAPCPPI
jgi:hypothetical protein